MLYAARSATTASSTGNPSRVTAMRASAERARKPSPSSARMRASSSARPVKAAVAGGVDALLQAQAHEQELVALRFGRQRLLHDHAVAVALDEPEPGLGMLLGRGGDAGVAGDEPAMGSGADAGIFAVAPIDEVVPGFRAGPGMVRDLVGRQAVRLADLLRDVVEDPRLFVGRHRELAGLEQPLEPGVGLDGELVERQVLGRVADGVEEFRAPRVRPLARAGIDEVEGSTGRRSRRRPRRPPGLPPPNASARAGADPRRSGPGRRARRG